MTSYTKFYAISTVYNSCRNPTKTNIFKPQFYNTAENERFHDKFVLV